MKKYRDNTSTRKNLEAAILDEAVSHVKYTAWGNQAKAEGYPEIAHCYQVAANNELSHAETWMRQLGLLRSVNENLQEAAEMEREGSILYVDYASDAENEGFDELKEMFLCASTSENNHMENFKRIHSELQAGEMFVSDNDKTKWMCYNCGFIMEGESPVNICPLCGRPETWFIKMKE